MIDTGMGPVFAFCETWMKSTFTEFLHRSEMLRRAGPTTLLRSEGRFPLRGGNAADATSPLSCCQGGVSLEVQTHAREEQSCAVEQRGHDDQYAERFHLTSMGLDGRGF